MRTPANGLLMRCPRSAHSRAGVLALGLGHALDHRELLAPLLERLRRQLGEVEVVELPARVVVPAFRRLDRRARARRALEHPQRQLERPGLALDVERAAGGVAQREIAEGE